MANILFGMLDAAKTALLVQQQAVDVTGNNISNVNTKGYSRQRLNMEQNQPVRYNGGTMGTGVVAKRKIQRMHDDFLGAQINNGESALGRWKAQKESLKKVELMFDESSGYGLSHSMNKFWNAWQKVANAPEGYTERVSLISNAQNMADSFNKLYRDVEKVLKDTDVGIIGHVDRINAITEKIAALNGKIIETEVSGYSANEFRDERDLLMKELSSMTEVESFEDADGYLTVSMTNGKPLVDRLSSWTLTTNTNASGYQDVYWVDSKGTQTNITSDIEGGELKGWIQARDVIIPDYLSRLNAVAQEIITEVNTIHTAGYALDGSQNSFFTGSDAHDIAVNSAIVANPKLIAASSTSAGLPGDNTVAVNIIALQNSLLMGGGSSTIDSYYQSLVSDVGSNVSYAESNHNHQKLTSASLDAYHEAIAGVNLDEEMVNLVKFQNAYNAASKVVTTVDGMLEALIAMV